MPPYKNSKAQAAISVLFSIGPSVPSYTGNPIAITGTTTSASASITAVSSILGLYPGQPISGAGIPALATIATVTGPSTITISANATASASAVALSVIPFVPVFEISQAPTSGQKWDLEETTNFNSGQFKEYLKTLVDSGKLTLTENRVSDDPGQVLLKAAFMSTQAFMFQITLPLSQDQVTTGDVALFAALVESYDDTLQVGKAIKIQVGLQKTGAVTYTEGA